MKSPVSIKHITQHGSKKEKKITSDLFIWNMITHSTASQPFIQTPNQMLGFHVNCNITQKPTREEVLHVACVQNGRRNPRWENNVSRGNCIGADEAFMHVHISSTHAEHEEHMETNVSATGSCLIISQNWHTTENICHNKPPRFTFNIQRLISGMKTFGQ